MIFAEAQMEEESLRVEQADLSWRVEQADLLHSFPFFCTTEERAESSWSWVLGKV